MPRSLMTERIDIYLPETMDKDSEGYADPPMALAMSDVPCMFQTATEAISEEYKRRELGATHAAFLIDKAAYELAMSVQGFAQIEFDGSRYDVVGGQNLTGRNRVYRLDLSGTFGG